MGAVYRLNEPPHIRLPALLRSGSINELEMADRSEQSPMQVEPRASPGKTLRAAESLAPHVLAHMSATPSEDSPVAGLDSGKDG